MNKVPATPTKDRILDSAERLFAENGFAATSLRAIIAEAAVNLAAIHYHYRSKDALLEAVIVRRIGPVNDERLARLDACERAAGEGGPTLEAVLEAFIAPTVPVRRSAPHFPKLMGRILANESGHLPVLMKKVFPEFLSRFAKALHRSQPDLPVVEIFWRIHFMAGVLSHTLRGGQDLEFLSGGLSHVRDEAGTTRRLVSFIAAGFRARLTEASNA
ncbi:MAG: TetR/AcrR family transcriptional regulator [Bryobacteraceae bacterium]